MFVAILLSKKLNSFVAVINSSDSYAQSKNSQC